MQMKQAENIGFGDGGARLKGNSQNNFGQGDDEAEGALLNPMDINEPIEGILISEEEKRIAPILLIEIMEGM